MANSPKILSLKFEVSEQESNVVFEFGNKSVVKQIPLGHGVLRASAILNDKGELIDAEIVTEKT